MRQITTDKELYTLYERVMHYAKVYKRTLPEIRFFILEGLEFASLLEKKVYPTSPLNIWEGKKMVTKKHRIETGQESALYYEVVQTGNPSYAYLNNGNSPMMQASVMAHVCGHCEFSELNVLKDSNKDRTEYVMYLVNKVNLARNQIGEKQYLNYWNACESIAPLIAPASQYNLERSVDTETFYSGEIEKVKEDKSEIKKALSIHSSTLESLMRTATKQDAFAEDVKKKKRQQNLSRTGYTLKAPCQDVLGFLQNYAPTSSGEKAILDYMYVVHLSQDFVVKTQIMNEGWAMYWEKKIMLDLFKERAVTGIIDYARVFSGVCYPRPYFQRNPYHLGYNLWKHIEQLYADGKVNLDFIEEQDVDKKLAWKVPPTVEPLQALEHILKTVTDYEFLRRFLTPALVHEFHLNRIDKRLAEHLRVEKSDIIDMDKQWVWLNPEPIKEEMLKFFTNFGRPRIYIIDTTFADGGLLLFHRDDGWELRKDWIKPTLRNINQIWKNGVYLLSRRVLYTFLANRYSEAHVGDITFDEVKERMLKNQKPFILE